MQGKLNICQLILDNVQEKNPADNAGITPLHKAAEEGYLDIVKLIIENIQEKNPSDLDGNTPLHHAAAMGWYSEVGTWWQSKYIEICRLILNNIEEKHPVNAAGHTPLDDARWCLHQEIYGEEVIQQLEQLWLDEAEEPTE